MKEGAAVWIGDYVYLYLREQDWWDGCATQVGPWNNGTYCIELSDGTKTNIMISNAIAYVDPAKSCVSWTSAIAIMSMRLPCRYPACKVLMTRSHPSISVL